MHMPLWEPPWRHSTHYGPQLQKWHLICMVFSCLRSSSHIHKGKTKGWRPLSISSQQNVWETGHSTWESFICMLANTWRKPTTASHSLLWARLCWFPMQGPYGEKDILIFISIAEHAESCCSNGNWCLLIRAGSTFQKSLFKSVSELNVFTSYYFFPLSDHRIYVYGKNH